jgi:sulfate permease, SulP family
LRCRPWDQGLIPGAIAGLDSLAVTNPGLSLPLLAWLPNYRREWVRDDVLAGVTTAAVVIPKSLAYATIAGLPIQIGLYTAFVPLIVYAMLGSSRPMSVTTTTTIAILTGAELAIVAPDGDLTTLLPACALLTLMVGAILLLAAIARLGFVASFISEPVLVGFKAGIGAVIIIDQLPKILGIHFAKGSLLNNLQEIAAGLGHLSWATVAVGVLTIAIIALVEKFRHGWPAPLIAIAVAIAGVTWLDLPSHGVELVGAIPSGLPSLTVPDLAFAKSLVEELWPAALGIALMSFTETAAVGRAFVAQDEPAPKPNTELLATGAANAAGALLGSMPAGGGMSQTAVNRMVGARTQVSGVVTAAMTLLTMLFLAPLLGLMPHAVLAGIVIVYSVGLIQPLEFRNILAIRRTEFVWAVVAFLGVMVIGTLKGILVAIIVSLVALAQQATKPVIHVLGRKPRTNVFRERSQAHPDDETYPGLLLLRLEGRIFFLNADDVAEKISALIAEEKPRVVAIDMQGVIDLEYSALKVLTEAERRRRESGVSLWLVEMSSQVLATVKRAPLGRTLGRDGMLHSLEIAVDRYRAMQTTEEKP